MNKQEQLPSDIAACHGLIQEQDGALETLARENEKLKFEIEQLKRYIYGRRSERHAEDDSQLPLFEQIQASAPESTLAEEVILEEIHYSRRKRSKADRFPANIQREVITKDVPEAERACSCCGEEMPIIDTDVRERLEFVPATMVVHETHYLKRACGKCKQGVSIAPPPAANEDNAALTPGSRYGFGVTAQIILGKYADHLPLYRLEDVFARAGVVIPRSTQVGLLDAAADLLGPLNELMKSRIIASGVIGMDDTPVKLQDPSLPGQMKTARMWLARGLEMAPYNVFFFHESRERNGPSKFLEDFNGYVTVDAYGVNDGVYLGSGERILASCCHAHVRRKFEAAKGNDPVRAARALSFYRQLFDIEDRGSAMTAEDRLKLRQAESLPLMNSLKSWLDEQRADGRVLPKSAIGMAVRYALNQWKPLQAMLIDGRLPIHNNDVERDLRALTIGRKNWMFIGSTSAGEVAARMYTVVASAVRHHLDAWAYLNDVLRKLASGEVALESLLPDTWAMEHPNSIRSYRQAESLARAAKTKARRARQRKLTKR
jgi:transposase